MTTRLVHCVSFRHRLLVTTHYRYTRAYIASIHLPLYLTKDPCKNRLSSNLDKGCLKCDGKVFLSLVTHSVLVLCDEWRTSVNTFFL